MLAATHARGCARTALAPFAVPSPGLARIHQKIGGEYQTPSACAHYLCLMIIPVFDLGFTILAISALFLPLSAIAFAE